MNATEVWVIVLNGGHFLEPIDDDGCDCFMAFPSEADAMIGLKSQIAKGWIKGGEGQVQRLH